MPDTQEVLLTVPALPEFLRVARVTASGLASRAGLSIDEVEDLRLALDELCFAVIGKGQAGASLELRYALSASELSITGRNSVPSDAQELGEFSKQILTALVNEHRVWQDEGKRSFSLLKRHGNGAS